MDKISTLEIFNFAKDISVKAGKILQESQDKSSNYFDFSEFIYKKLKGLRKTKFFFT